MLLQLWPRQNIVKSKLQYNAKVFIPASAASTNAISTSSTPAPTVTTQHILLPEHFSFGENRHLNIKRKRKEEASSNRRIVKTLRKLVVDESGARKHQQSPRHDFDLVYHQGDTSTTSPYRLKPFPNLKDSFRAIAEDYGYNEKAFAHWNSKCCSLVVH